MKKLLLASLLAFGLQASAANGPTIECPKGTVWYNGQCTPQQFIPNVGPIMPNYNTYTSVGPAITNNPTNSVPVEPFNY